MSKDSFKFDTDGWYCVTKGKISFCVLLFPLSTEPLLVNLISDSSFSTILNHLAVISSMHPAWRRELMRCLTPTLECISNHWFV